MPKMKAGDMEKIRQFKRDIKDMKRDLKDTFAEAEEPSPKTAAKRKLLLLIIPAAAAAAAALVYLVLRFAVSVL